MLCFKLISGTLLVAGVKRGQLKKGPKSAPGAGDATVTGTDGGIPKGKAVEPADFVVGHHTPVQNAKGGKPGFEEEAEGSGSSGSDTHTNPQHVQLADLQQNRA